MKKTEKKSKYVVSPSAVYIRSILDLGGYCDHTVTVGPSMTDPSQDEPIQRLVDRLLRGEQVRSVIPQYDEKPSFEGQSVAERDGFDLSDIPAVLKAGDEAKKVLRPKPEQKPQEEAPKPSPEPKKEALEPK